VICRHCQSPLDLRLVDLAPLLRELIPHGGLEVELRHHEQRRHDRQSHEEKQRPEPERHLRSRRRGDLREGLAGRHHDSDECGERVQRFGLALRILRGRRDSAVGRLSHDVPPLFLSGAATIRAPANRELER